MHQDRKFNVRATAFLSEQPLNEEDSEFESAKVTCYRAGRSTPVLILHGLGGPTLSSRWLAV